ncbi:hypothetical protein MBLNU459_g6745t1 [Dothideomycetes sp. NU459]
MLFGDAPGTQTVASPDRSPRPTAFDSTSPPFSSRSEEFADDEHSSLASITDMAEPLGDQVQEEEVDEAAPRYAGEDTRPTSTKELLGFYAYSFAAEVYVVCGIGSFIPITLEQLAREHGVLQSDKTTPCITSASPKSALVMNAGNGGQCIVTVLGMEVNTASFAMYTFSISVLFQAALVITMSGAADHGHYRKALLLTFAFIGAISTMMFLPVTGNVYLLGSLLAMIGNICFGASFVLLNSFLPLLVRWHPTTHAVHTHTHQDPVEDMTAHDSTPLLLPPPQETSLSPASPAAASPQLQLSTKISSYGVSIGYLAALFLQGLSVVIVVATGSTTFSMRLVLFVVGLWWFVFTIPTALFMRPRPGPPLPGKRDRSWSQYLAYSWTNLGHTIARARRLRDVMIFLAAWFMISDAVATVSGTAILFAKTTLGMHTAALSLINVVVTISGMIGALTWSKVSRMMALSPAQTILACICLFEAIPIYGLLGYIPAIRRAGVGGLQQPWEMYPLGAVYGLVLGGLASYCRSLFGELIPEGSEAAFYALYAVTDKGSSVFGPFIVGAITDLTGEIRPAFFFLAVLIGLPIPLLSMVDVERGKREGAALSKEAASQTDVYAAAEACGEHDAEAM